MSSFAAFQIGNHSWVIPAALLIVAALFFIYRSYRRSTAHRAISLAAATLKTVGLLALAVCLIEPLYSGVRARPGENLFAILVDDSQSLNISDRPGAETLALLRQPLLSEENPGWQTRLGQDFELHRYLFDAALHSVQDFHATENNGTASALNQLLQTLVKRLQDRPLAGVLLFSDGNSTDTLQELSATQNLPPIYPVIWGAATSPPDIAVTNVSVSQSPFEDAPISVKADVSITGDIADEVTAEILDPHGNRVAEQTLAFASGSEPTAFRLQFAAPQRGVSFYRLRVAAQGEWEQFDDPTKSSEATLANNERLLTIDRGSRKQRVLYVTGRPNWEFKFLRRALADDEAAQLTGLIRVAKREAKFKWRDGKTESANPLFRGFTGGEAEETEQYDQPVFVRIDTEDPTELLEGFPKSAEKLFQFDALLLDDVEAESFTRDEMALIQEFVSRRGGSLLMLGGQESFSRGGYARTPLQDLLPIYLDRETDTEPAGRFRLSLSRDGWLQPWVRLRRNEEEEQDRLREMPEFWTLNPLASVKPGATVLANVTDDGGTQFPALVAQQFGRGKAAALAIGDLWRWALRRQNPEKNDHARAVRQMLRWLIADVPGRVEVAVKSESSPGVRIAVQVHDENYQPRDNANVRISVGPVDGSAVTIAAEPSLEAAGLYTADYVPRQAGAYLVKATVTDAEGTESEQATAGWVYAPAVEEFHRLGWNHQYLNQLAEQTGGQIVQASDLEEFVAKLPHQHAPVTERYTYPLWHQSSVFLFALSCFIGEWGLRRYRGLP